MEEFSWKKRESGYYDSEYLFRANANSKFAHTLVIHILELNGDFTGRVYPKFDGRNVLRTLAFCKLKGSTLEEIVFLSLLKAKEQGWSVEVSTKCI